MIAKHEILCYNHECRGKKHWCCSKCEECNPNGCEYYKWYREFVKRGEE